MIARLPLTNMPFQLTKSDTTNQKLLQMEVHKKHLKSLPFQK